MDPDGGDFSLSAGSPSIDAGNPDPVFNDPDGTRNDMGALYFDQSSTSVQTANEGTEYTSWGGVKALFR